MKRRIPFLPALSMIAFAFGAGAAPPRLADIPDHPAWVLHIDGDALRQTYLGKYLVYQLDKPEVNSNMMAYQSIFSFDLRTQLHGVTLYGDGPTPKEAIVIVYAEVDPDHLIKLVQSAEAANAVTNGQHVIYSWIDRNRHPADSDGPRKYAVIEANRIITGNAAEPLMAALAVIDGTAPNLAASKALPQLETAGPGAFAVAAARNLDVLGSDPNMALLKMATQLNFRASETDNQLKAVLTLELGDETTARQMSLVAQGLVAAMSLQKENPRTAKLAGGASVKQDGSTLRVTLSAPSIDLIAAAREYSEKKEKQRAGME